MAYALVANTGIGSTDGNGAVTSAINTTGANLIVIAIHDRDVGASATPTDSKLNSGWTGLTAQAATGSSRVKFWYFFNPTVGSGHTFTYEGPTDCQPTITVSAWSGAVSSPFDQQNGGSNSSSSTQATGSVTPSQNNELLIAACTVGDTGFQTINGGFTETDDVELLLSTHRGGMMAYLIQGTATAANPTFTNGAPGGIAAAIATFKSEAGGTPFFAQLGVLRIRAR